MESKQPSPIDLLVEAHAGLERQGPGCAEETGRALAFLGDLDLIANAADLGCGTGAQTLLLAQHLKGSVVGLDLFPAFVDVLNGQACEQGVADRVRGVVGSMDDLPFQRESLDLIWSEGAIDNIGFEKGLAYWRGFL
ncbi:MAG: class I SAM-dependent methyltransferase [Gordonibacter pamelaeae]